MASNCDNTVELEIQLDQGSSSNGGEFTHQTEGLSQPETPEEFGCETVDGVLATTPISRFPEAGTKIGQSSGSRSSGGCRTLTASEVTETKEVFFQVFKFPEGEEEYLLEMHQVQTGNVDRFHLVLGKDEKDGKKFSMNAYDLEIGQHVVFPMTEDPPAPKFFKKYQLSLQERLVGWIVQKRKRSFTEKEEMFYKHGSCKTFRSFVGMAGFILYSCEPKDLQLIHHAE